MARNKPPVFKLWPEPKEGQPYGPTDLQRLLFIEDLPPEERPHQHPVDIVLYVGGARCLGKGTKIITFDGSLKKVEDIKVGDLLMGPDSCPRYVSETCKGSEEMYLVTPKNGKPFTCNKSHILSLKTSGVRVQTWGTGGKRKTRYSSGDIVNISVSNYLKLSDREKKLLKLWRPRNIQSICPRIDPCVTGFEIEKLGIGEYFGFKLEGNDSLFLLEDFIVQHNSGKTIGATARTISYALRHQKSTVVVGAVNYPLLQRTALNEWEKRFTHLYPWDHLQLPNKLIIKKPTQNNKQVIFSNGSRAFFIHFNNPEILRGMDVDLCWFEEACLIPDEATFDELVRRLSGNKGPIRQLILTTNPDQEGWLMERFKLHQFRDEFTGEKEPIGNPCKCHLCQPCLNGKLGEFEYQAGTCPSCGHKKENDCPGNQDFYRVIMTKSSDNPHLQADFVQTQLSALDEKTAAVFVEGKVEYLHEGFVYKGFGAENVFPDKVEYDPDKDIYWSLDFNYRPQCSVICQIFNNEQGQEEVAVIDEIIKWEFRPEQVAAYFCTLPEILEWKEGGKTVFIYGDPAGLWGQGKDLAPSYFQLVKDVLLLQGFKVCLMMRLPDPDSPVKETIKIPVSGRVDATNAMLRNNVDGVGISIRLKLNRRCVNTIKSLRELRWDVDGKSIDKKCDRNASRQVNKSRPMCMSHPTDALGYFIYKRFPVVRRGSKLFFQFPGQEIIEISTAHVEHLDRKQVQENIRRKYISRKIERKKKREEAREARIQRQQQKSRTREPLWSILKRRGLLPY